MFQHIQPNWQTRPDLISGFAAMEVSRYSTPIPSTKPLHSAGVFIFMYFVYILYSKTFDRYYVGHCEEMAARLGRHNAGQVTSTKPYKPWEVVYVEQFESRAAAAAREKEIKQKKSRKYISYLIARGM